ncbi:MAG: SUMF1/EgtB/PvdO family nonheme iron enzyme [Planctomycetota bacterium]
MVCRARLTAHFALLVWLVCGGVAPASATVTFDWAVVGNPGNAPDPRPSGGRGAVGYTYRIATTEVTNGQYAAFLNAVAAADPNGLFRFDVTLNPRNYSGITRTGQSGSYAYTPILGRANEPVNWLSWYDAARFANWMTNGQGSGGTETGVYNFSGPTTLDSITRDPTNPNQVFLPTEDEWYKAAYHDASAGTAGTYFTYATGTNDVPYSDNPDSLNTPDNTNVANFFKDDGVANGYDDGYAVWDRSDRDNSDPFTPVGAYTQATSPYGTFDQAGNVREWNENVLESDPRSHIISGGHAADTEPLIRSSFRWSQPTDSEQQTLGFRVATFAVFAPLPGDANGDGVVDLLDFDVLAQNFGAPGNGAPAPSGPADGDFNGDGIVDLLDFDILSQNFGQSAPASLAAAAPEPASLGTMCVIALAGLRRPARTPSR